MQQKPDIFPVIPKVEGRKEGTPETPVSPRQIFGLEIKKHLKSAGESLHKFQCPALADHLHGKLFYVRQAASTLYIITLLCNAILLIGYFGYCWSKFGAYM